MSTLKKNRKKNDRIDLATYLTGKGPGDEFHAPTPERAAKAIASKQTIDAHVIHTERGLPTGQFYWRITPVIESLVKRGTLDQNQADIALRFMRHYAGSRHHGPATSKFLPFYDRGYRDLSPPERAIAFGQSVARARKAVHPMFHRCLNWLERAAEDEWPLSALGEMYYPELSQSMRTQRAITILQITLELLGEHYGMLPEKTRFSVSADDIQEVIRTMRVTFEMQEKIVRKRGG